MALVERCAACNGAFRVVDAARDDVMAVRDAARQRRYLAERVEHTRDVDKAEIGHHISCALKD